MRVVVLLLGLTACAAPVPVTKPGGSASCGADRFQYLIGQPMETLRGGAPEATRIIPHGTAVTMDYSAERMNIDLNASGAVTRVWCG